MRTGARGGHSSLGAPAPGGIQGELSIVFDHTQRCGLDLVVSAGRCHRVIGSKSARLEEKQTLLARSQAGWTVTAAVGLPYGPWYASRDHRRFRPDRHRPRTPPASAVDTRCGRSCAVRPAPGEIGWDPERGALDPGDLDGLDAVVHLAGAGIGDHRWTDEYKALVLDSRVLGTTLLAKAIADSGGPRVLLSASAIGYLRQLATRWSTRRSPLGDDFLARVGDRRGRRSTAAAEDAGVRVAHLRTGIVLSATGRRAEEDAPAVQARARRPVRQRPAVDELDLDRRRGGGDRAPARLGRAPGRSTSPHRTPCRNADFAKTLGARARAAGLVVPVPEFGPEAACSAASSPTRCCSAGSTSLPTVLLADGFRFEHPQLEPALRAVLGR